jgi:hypothetical protein
VGGTWQVVVYSFKDNKKRQMSNNVTYNATIGIVKNQIVFYCHTFPKTLKKLKNTSS